MGCRKERELPLQDDSMSRRDDSMNPRGFKRQTGGPQARGYGDISVKDKQSVSQYVAWQSERGGPYVPTPIVYRGYLYVCGDRGVLTCFNAERARRPISNASMIRASDSAPHRLPATARFFFSSEDGDKYVLKAGPSYELLAVNPMGEAIIATPAISGGLLIVRGPGRT
jgi:PQQ-like domain